MLPLTPMICRITHRLCQWLAWMEYKHVPGPSLCMILLDAGHWSTIQAPHYGHNYIISYQNQRSYAIVINTKYESRWISLWDYVNIAYTCTRGNSKAIRYASTGQRTGWYCEWRYIHCLCYLETPCLCTKCAICLNMFFLGKKCALYLSHTNTR